MEGLRDEGDCPAARSKEDSAKGSSALLDAAAKNVGYAQLAAKHLDPRLGKALVDSANETMELAQALLMEAGQKRSMNTDASTGSCEDRNDSPSLEAHHPNSQPSRSHFAGGGGSDQGGTQQPASSKKRRPGDDSLIGAKKSKLDRAIVPLSSTSSSTSPFLSGSATAPSLTAPYSFASSTTPFSFGNVQAALPNGTFVFGSTASAAKQASAGGNASIGGKRTLPGESPGGVGNATKAPKEVLEARKILRAGRKYRNGQESKHQAAPGSGSKASSVFASVNLSPTAPPSKKENGSKNSAATQAPAFPVATPGKASVSETPNNKTKVKTAADGKLVDEERGDNSAEDVLFKVRAKRHKKVGNGWKKYEAGDLRLCRNKQTSKCSMVIRSDSGQVLFNVAIAQGMAFTKLVKDNEKVAFVRFGAVEDADIGPRPFCCR